MRTQDLRLAALSAAVITLPSVRCLRTIRRNRRHRHSARNRSTKHTALDSSIHRGATRARRHHERPRPRHHGAERRAESAARAARSPNFYIRGLPGVGLYVDGVWQDGFGFQQMNFSEIRARRGAARPARHAVRPQHQRRRGQHDDAQPADEFGARVKLDIGDFNRRDASIAVDLPLTDKLKTKFMGATVQNDGFLESLTTPWDFGSQDDTILRADILWEPTDTLLVALHT